MRTFVEIRKMIIGYRELMERIEELEVSANLRVIFKNKELYEADVTRYHNEVTYYNLDVVIALAFRCKGHICRLFRQWLRDQVKQPLIKEPQPLIIQIGNSSFLS